MDKFSTLFLLSACLVGSKAQTAVPIKIHMLKPGLSLQEFKVEPVSTHGDSTVVVVRLDPKRFGLELFTVSGGDTKQGQSAKVWAKQKDALVTTNAGMYQKDYKTSVAYLKTGHHINQSRFSKDKMMLGFADMKAPELLDKECGEFTSATTKYSHLLQGIRMISCKGKNVWSQQKKKWSQVAVATLQNGQIAILFCRSPYTTFDFIEIVKKLPLGIKRMMYLEGGPPAQLFVNTKKLAKGWIGSYSTGANENDDNMFALPIPNVLAVVEK